MIKNENCLKNSGKINALVHNLHWELLCNYYHWGLPVN